MRALFSSSGSKEGTLFRNGSTFDARALIAWNQLDPSCRKKERRSLPKKVPWSYHPWLVLSILASAEGERETETSSCGKHILGDGPRKVLGRESERKVVLMLLRGRAESEFGFRVLLSVTPD